MSNLGRVLAVLILVFALLLLHEALTFYNPSWQVFKSTHFFTPYPAVDSSLVNGVDSNLNRFSNDSIEYNLDSIQQDSSGQIILSEEAYAAYHGEEYLVPFFEALKELRAKKRKKVRIAYFGDSTTEGDLAVSNLRDFLQRLFGGRGVGYVSVAPFGTGMRTTIKQRPSNNWNMVNYFKKPTERSFPFGYSGDYSTPNPSNIGGNYTISFEPAANYWPTMTQFDNIYLFYGKAHQPDSLELKKPAPKLLVKTDGSDTATYFLDQEALVNRLTIQEGSVSHKVDLQFFFSSLFPIYGLSFESDEGIIVDNLAKRNDSGTHLSRISSEVLRQYNEYLGCDLIILHYGANALSSKHHDYTFYEPMLMASIQHLKRSMPGVPILILGYTDKAIKINESLQTDPAVYGMIKAQKNVAIQSKSAFLSLFEEMGGEGSMIKWGEEGWVAKDYVHFNTTGAKKISGFVKDFLLDCYHAHNQGVSLEEYKGFWRSVWKLLK